MAIRKNPKRSGAWWSVIRRQGDRLDYLRGYQNPAHRLCVNRHSEPPPKVLRFCTAEAAAFADHLIQCILDGWHGQLHAGYIGLPSHVLHAIRAQFVRTPVQKRRWTRIMCILTNQPQIVKGFPHVSTKA